MQKPPLAEAQIALQTREAQLSQYLTAMNPLIHNVCC